MLYFDTSAILPYYRFEPSSDAVQRLLNAQRSPVLISHLTEVEVASAVARWVRMGELTEVQANKLLSAFRRDVSAGRFRRCALESGHFQRALQWLTARETSLRTLDALHLACSESEDAKVITNDTALLEAANQLGVAVTQPGI